VLTRLVVAELARGGQALEHLQARLLQLSGPGGDTRLELELGLALLQLQPADLQQVAHPQANLVLVEGLGEKVAGAAGKRPALDPVVGVAG
jgi:hypothetical protein